MHNVILVALSLVLISAMLYFNSIYSFNLKHQTFVLNFLYMYLKKKYNLVTLDFFSVILSLPIMKLHVVMSLYNGLIFLPRVVHGAFALCAAEIHMKQSKSYTEAI